MTKNIVDSVLEFANFNNMQIGLIPSRRQVEFNGGYVNNWTTSDFCSYVRSRSSNITLQRDHAGPGQGQINDDGYESLAHDCSFFDIIHIDPWKAHPDYKNGLDSTIRMIEFCNDLNPRIKYEVATEESIRRFEVEELESLLGDLQNKLGDLFQKIAFAVIQSGTGIKGTDQIGQYDKNRLVKMVSVCNKFKLMSKEHNGDYIGPEVIKSKFAVGLDAINIAPEMGLVETEAYLNSIDEESFELFWHICHKSGRWRKWVDNEFDPVVQKKDLVRICGHYVLSDPDFKTISDKYDIIDEVKRKIYAKLLCF